MFEPKLRMASMGWLTAASACLLFLIGCAGGAGPRFTESPTVVQNPNPSAPLAAVLKFETNAAVETMVSVSDGENKWELNFDCARRPEEGLPLIGFRPGREYDLTVTITDESGSSTSSNPLKFQSADLPADPAEFPEIETLTLNTESMEPGYRLFNPRRRVPRNAQQDEEQQRRFGESFGMLIMVDQAGEPVWYYKTDSRIAGFRYRDEGRILFVTADFRLVEIDMLGNVTRSWYAAERPQGAADEGIAVDALTFHHDADILPDGNVIALSTVRREIPSYYTSEVDKAAPRKTQWVMGDRALELSPDGEIVWEWNAFEHLPVMRIGYETFSQYWERRGFPGTIDWSHANEIKKLDDDTVMINFRYQSAIVAVAPGSGEIKWIFGEPSGWPAEVEPKLIRLEGDGRWPWHQHSPTFTSRGTLLLFDNGNYRARPFEAPMPVAETRSRAVEYAVDLEHLTAREVWSSETSDEKSVVSIAMGSVSVLEETGNILAGYGAVVDPERMDEMTWTNRASFDQVTRCVEYTADNPAKVVWELELKRTGENPRIGWNLFNCLSVGSLEP